MNIDGIRQHVHKQEMILTMVTVTRNTLSANMSSFSFNIVLYVLDGCTLCLIEGIPLLQVPDCKHIDAV